MAWVIPAMMIASTVLGVVGQQQQGKAAQASANMEAAQMEQNAGQARAAAQRTAGEKRREARLANSRLQSLAGGGGSDPTVARLSSDIAGEGELRALTSMYEGEDRAQGLETGASVRRWEGQQARKGANIRSVSTVLNNSSNLYDAGSTLYQKYGKGGAKSQVD